MLQTSRLLIPAALLGLIFTAAGNAGANPQNGVVVAGNATISHPAPSNVTVTQKSQKAVINWQSFSVGSREAVRFAQPGSSSVTLNRVIGGDLSTIAGSLSANGIVFLVNPNGVVFTHSAQIDVNGLLATTHDIANDDFMAGRYRFNIPGNPKASVVNEGTISAAQEGLVALVAPSVRNDGVIAARLGRISLGSGDDFTVDLYGDQLIQFAVPMLPTNETSAAKEPLVENSGTISADGGTIMLTADTAARIVDNAINNTGLIEANAVHRKEGEIILDGGDHGKVQVSGTLDASGKEAGQNGGCVKVFGTNVALGMGGTIDASGDVGGGTVFMGGNFHGTGSKQNAMATTIAANAKIDANALTAGNGGLIAVWSDQLTTFNGSVSAHGGIQSGSGGFVEVSGQKQLAFNGTVDLRADNGEKGTLLLDPENVTIAANGDTPTLPQSGDTLLTGTVDDSILTVSTLEDALTLGNVTVQTGSNGSQAGDLEVASNISWDNDSSLTLSAYRNLSVDTGVTISNIGAGNLALHADNTGTGVGSVNFNGTGKVDFLQSTGNILVYYNPPDNPVGSIVNSSSYTSPSDYNSAVLVNNTVANQLTSYMLVNSVYDLQNIENNLTADYALGHDIDASSTTTWNSGTGFSPIGDNSSSFIGGFYGQGMAIDGLVIRRGWPYLGLFGCNGGLIRGVVLVNEAVSAADLSPSGSAFYPYVGGLAGMNDGIIADSGVSGSIEGNTYSYTGGAVGWNGGTVRNSYSSADITGSGIIGGLVGINSGAISNSQATGTVVGSNVVGGLVGRNMYYSSIDKSYATGNVTATADNSDVGGLVGINGTYGESGGKTTDIISRSFSSGTVSAKNTVGSNIGGLVGANTNGQISQSFETGAVVGGTGSGVHTYYPNCAGGLVGFNGEPYAQGTIGQSYAVGNVSASFGTQKAGLVGGVYAGDPIVGIVYWDVTTTGQTAGGPMPIEMGGGLTTAQFQSGSLPAGFDSTVWTAKQGQYPALTWQLPTTQPPSAATVVTFGTGITSAPNPTTITWSIADVPSAYGTLPTLGDMTFSGVAAADSNLVNGIAGLFNGNNTPVSLSSILPAGIYTEEVTDLTGSAAGSYTLSATGDTSGILTIVPKSLTWSVADAFNTYGTQPALGNAALQGVLSTDSNDVAATVAAFSGSNQVALSSTTPTGTYAEKVTGLTGTEAPNYTLASTGNTHGTLTINAAPVHNTPPPQLLRHITLQRRNRNIWHHSKKHRRQNHLTLSQPPQPSTRLFL